MNLAILGTGSVGRALAAKSRDLGHDVLVGSRAPGDDCVRFAQAAAHGDVVVNATAGVASLQALEAAGAENLAGKVLVDVANPLDFSQGFPPRLSVSNDDSLAEQIQRAFPDAQVVKALNTMNHLVMVEPGRVPGDHHAFLASDHRSAKRAARELLAGFGWPEERVLDLGDLTAARGLEMVLPLWISIMRARGDADFNFRVSA